MEKKIKQIISFILVLCLTITYLPIEYSIDFFGNDLKSNKVEAKGPHSVDKDHPNLYVTTYPKNKGDNFYAAGYRVSIYYYGNNDDGDKPYAPSPAKYQYQYVSGAKSYDKDKKKGKLKKGKPIYALFRSYDDMFYKKSYASSAVDKNINDTEVSATYFRDKMAAKSSYYVLDTYNMNFNKIYDMIPSSNKDYTAQCKGKDGFIYKKVNKDRIFTTSSGLSGAAKTLDKYVDHTFKDDILNFGPCYKKDATKMIQQQKLNQIEKWFGTMNYKYTKAYKKDHTVKKEDYFKSYIDYLKELKKMSGIDDDFIDLVIKDVKNNSKPELHSYIQIEPVVVLGFNKSVGYATTYSEFRFAATQEKASTKGVFSYRRYRDVSVPLQSGMTTSPSRTLKIKVQTVKSGKNKKENYYTTYFKKNYNNGCCVSCATPILGVLYQPYMYTPESHNNGAMNAAKGYSVTDTLLDAGYSNRSGIGFYGLGGKQVPDEPTSAEVNATINLLYDGEVTEDSLESGKGTWQATTAVTEIVLNDASGQYQAVSSAWGDVNTSDLYFTKYIDSANSKILHKIGTMYQYVKEGKNSNSYSAKSVEKYSTVGAKARKDKKATKMDKYSTVAYYNFLVQNKVKKNISTITKRLDSAVKDQFLAKDSDGNYKLKSVWSRMMVSSGDDSSLNAGFKVNMRTLQYGKTRAITKIISNGVMSGSNGVYKEDKYYSLHSILAYPLYNTNTNSKFLQTIKVDKKDNGDEAIDTDNSNVAIEDSNIYLRYRTDKYTASNAKTIHNNMTAIGSNKALATQAYYLQLLSFRCLLGSPTRTATVLSELDKIKDKEQYALNVLVGAKLGDVSSYYTWAVYDYENKGLSTSGTVTKSYDISTYASIPVGSYTTTKSDGSVKINPIIGIKRILILPNRNNTGKKSEDMAISQEELENAVKSGCSGANSGDEKSTFDKVHANIVSILSNKATAYGKEGTVLRDYFDNRLDVNKDTTYDSSEIVNVGFYQDKDLNDDTVDDSNSDIVTEDSINDFNQKPDDNSEGNSVEDTETTVDSMGTDDSENVDLDKVGITSPLDEDNAIDTSKYLNGVFAAYDMKDITKEQYLTKVQKYMKNNLKLNALYLFKSDEDSKLTEIKVNDLTKLSDDDFDTLCESLESNAIYTSDLSSQEYNALSILNGKTDEDVETIDVSLVESLYSKQLNKKLNLAENISLFRFFAVKVFNLQFSDVMLGGEDYESSVEVPDAEPGLNQIYGDDEDLDDEEFNDGVDLDYEDAIVDTNPAHQRGYTIVAYGTIGKVTTSVGIDLQPWELNYVYADLQAAVMGANEQMITDKNESKDVLDWNAFVRTHSDDIKQTVRARVGGYVYSITGARTNCTEGPHGSSKEQKEPPNSRFVAVIDSAYAVWCSGWGGEDYATNNIIISDETDARGSTIDKSEKNGTTNWAYSVNKDKLHADKDGDYSKNYYSLFLQSDEMLDRWHGSNASYAVDTKQDKNTKPYWAVWSRVTKNFNHMGPGEAYKQYYFTVNTLYETAYFSYVYNLIRYISGDMRNVSDFYNYNADYATVNYKIDDKYNNFVKECLQFAYANIPDLDTSYVTMKSYSSGVAKSAFTFRYANQEHNAKDYISEHVILQAYMQDDGDNIRYHALGDAWKDPEKTVNFVNIKDTDKRNQNIKYCDLFYTYQENSQKPYYHFLDHSWESDHYNQTIQWTQLVAHSAAPEDREHCHNIPGTYYVWKCLGHKATKLVETSHNPDKDGTCTNKCVWKEVEYTWYHSDELTHCSHCVKDYKHWIYDISDFNKKCYHERCIGGSMSPVFETRIVTTPTATQGGKLQDGKHQQKYKLNYKEYIYKYVVSPKKLGTTTNTSGIARLNKTGDSYVSGKSFGENNGRLGNLSYNSSTNSKIITNFASAYLDSSKYSYAADKYGVVSNVSVFAYYPEVNMIAYGYFRGQKLNHLKDVTPYIVPTIAEIERGTVGGLLNIMSIKNVNYDNKDKQKKTGTADYAGTTISDSVATSTQADALSSKTNLFNSNKSIRQVIYAGSDVTVTGDANFKLTLYGYAMDLIKPEDGTNDMLTVSKGDGTTATMSEPYTYIVANNADLYQLWWKNIQDNKFTKPKILPLDFGKAKVASENFKILQNRYQAWVDKVTNLNNWSADYTLNVHDDTDNKYNSKFTDFSATIGTLTTADNKKATDKTLTTQTNVYPLHIKNGEVVKNDAGYVAFINQLARDYFGNTDSDVTPNYVTLTDYPNNRGTRKVAKLKDYDRAEQLFENSTLASCVTNAIENARSDDNVSGTASNRQNTMASELGTSHSTDAVRNWYDEEVRTIVLRRFKTESLYFNNITASDKIDYNTAPDAGTTVDNWTGRQADWYLNMYYQDNDTDYTKTYNTSTISNTKVSQKLEVIRNLYVDNASFIIPSATTDNMGW